MIDHMLVDLKKYYRSNIPNYIGKTIKAPNQPIHTWLGDPGLGTVKAGNDWKPNQLTNIKVLGQGISSKNEVYLYAEQIDDVMGGTPYGYYWLKLDELIQNGGVLHSPLTKICHVLILIRKEISMALQKMKYQLKDWYEGKEPNLIGKAVKKPNQPIQVYAGVSGYSDWKGTGTNHIYLQKYGNIKEIPSGVISGVIKQGDFSDTTEKQDIGTALYTSSLGCWFKLEDLLQNGGVLRSRIFLMAQGLQSLFKEVVACQ